jgi:hypothetical protein
MNTYKLVNNSKWVINQSKLALPKFSIIISFHFLMLLLNVNNNNKFFFFLRIKEKNFKFFCVSMFFSLKINVELPIYSVQLNVFEIVVNTQALVCLNQFLHYLKYI